MVKAHMMEMEDLGLADSIPQKWVCKDHIEETYHKKIIIAEGELGVCS